MNDYSNDVNFEEWGCFVLCLFAIPLLVGWLYLGYLAFRHGQTQDQWLPLVCWAILQAGGLFRGARSE